MTLWENAVLGRHDDDEFSGAGGFLFIKRIKELASRLVERSSTCAPAASTSTAGTLSGGNQQKLILARELETDPKLWWRRNRPVGSTSVRSSSSGDRSWSRRPRGAAVLLISAELDEIYALSDRIVTLYEGRITGEFAPDAPAEEVGRGMLGDVAAVDR